MEITILAGRTAKIPFRGIPGITRIPADSGRNTWGTVKNSQGDIPINPAGASELTQGIYKFKFVNFFFLSFLNFSVDHTNVVGCDNGNIFFKLRNCLLY